MRMGLGLGLTAAQSSGGAVDPDAAIAAILSDGAHLAFDTGRMADFWQTTGGVDPVTADGQAVAWANSRFGTTTYNLSNSTVGTFPAYKTDGYLLFARASSQLLFGASNTFGILNGAPAAFFALSVWIVSIAGIMVPIGIGTPTTTTSRFTPQINLDGSVTLNCRRDDADANTAITSAAGAVAVGGYYTLSGQVICATGEMKLWINGVEAASGTLVNPGAAFSATNSARVRIGAQVSSTAQYFDGYIRRPVVLRKALTAEERAVVEEWVAGSRTYAGGYIAADGIDTWFNSPELAKKSSKAYFGSVVDSVGIFLNEFDLTTKKARKVWKTSATVDNNDDHDGGGALLLSTGNLLWMPADHNGDDLRAVLGLPGTFTDNNLQAQIGSTGYSYSQMAEIGGVIHCFTRLGVANNWLTTSSDGGTTWTTLVQQFTNATADRPYPQYCKISETEIGVLITDAHPDEAAFNTSVYFARRSSGQWNEADGTSLGALPIEVTTLTKIFDGPTNDPSWTWDLRRYAALSETVGLFASFPTYDAHRYHRTVIQDDGSFVNEIIYSDAGYSLYGAAPNSQQAYSGGMVLHPTNKDIVYACISKLAVRSGKHQLYRLDRVSAGVWSETQLTDTDDEWFRPSVCDGLLICRYGPYSNYTTFGGCNTWAMPI